MGTSNRIKTKLDGNVETPDGGFSLRQRERGLKSPLQAKARSTSGRRHSDFWLLTFDFQIPQGYQGEALPS